MSDSELMPAIFIGHGSPGNALADNEFTQAWAALAKRIPRPDAIVVVSAHWETKGILITAAERQRTIHDYYNFPPEMYALDYPAPGSPTLAKKIEAMLLPTAPNARADLDSWGLDHGTWTVLKFMYPEADIPVLQVSQDLRRNSADHYNVGGILGALRRERILVMGSGNIVHGLRSFQRNVDTPFDWAARFDQAVRDHVLHHDHEKLIDYRSLPEAALAVPEPEHYHPLLYVLGASEEDDPIEILTNRVMTSISMTSVAFGLH